MGLIPGLLEWLVISPWISGSLTVPDGVAVVFSCLSSRGFADLHQLFKSSKLMAREGGGKHAEQLLLLLCEPVILSVCTLQP